MKKTLIIIAIVLLLGGLAALGYLYYDARKDVSDLRAEISNANQQLEDFKSNPELAAEAEVDRYIEEVGKLYALPSD